MWAILILQIQLSQEDLRIKRDRNRILSVIKTFWEDLNSILFNGGIWWQELHESISRCDSISIVDKRGREAVIINP